MIFLRGTRTLISIFLKFIFANKYHNDTLFFLNNVLNNKIFFIIDRYGTFLTEKGFQSCASSFRKRRAKNQLHVNLSGGIKKINTLQHFAGESDKITFTDKKDEEKEIFIQKKIGFVPKSKRRIRRLAEKGIYDTSDDVYVILYDMELIKMVGNFNKIYVDATYKTCPNIQNVYQLLTILVEIDGVVTKMTFTCLVSKIFKYNINNLITGFPSDLGTYAQQRKSYLHPYLETVKSFI